MKEDLHLYDTSNFPENHMLHSKMNEKKPGVMKDESPEFVGLRSKMFAIQKMKLKLQKEF